MGPCQLQQHAILELHLAAAERIPLTESFEATSTDLHLAAMVLLWCCRVMAADQVCDIVGDTWWKEAAARAPLLQQLLASPTSGSEFGFKTGAATPRGRAAAGPEQRGQDPLPVAADGGQPTVAAPMGQLWWPRDDACDCCGEVLGGEKAVVCPECRVARYCCKAHEVEARVRGLHNFVACRLLSQWRLGNWHYVKGV
jgi:hypothetical protein